jgi:hypothetical protein
MVTPRRGAGGSVVLFGWCRAVEGKAKEACGSLTMEAEREKRERSGGRHGRATQRTRGGGLACAAWRGDSQQGVRPVEAGGGSATWSCKAEVGEAWGADGWTWGLK